MLALFNELAPVQLHRGTHGSHIAMHGGAFCVPAISLIVADSHMHRTIFFLVDELNAMDSVDLLVHSDSEFSNNVPALAVAVSQRGCGELRKMLNRFIAMEIKLPDYAPTLKHNQGFLRASNFFGPDRSIDQVFSVGRFLKRSNESFPGRHIPPGLQGDDA